MPGGSAHALRNPQPSNNSGLEEDLTRQLTDSAPAPNIPAAGLEETWSADEELPREIVRRITPELASGIPVVLMNGDDPKSPHATTLGNLKVLAEKGKLEGFIQGSLKTIGVKSGRWAVRVQPVYGEDASAQSAFFIFLTPAAGLEEVEIYERSKGWQRMLDLTEGPVGIRAAIGKIFLFEIREIEGIGKNREIEPEIGYLIARVDADRVTVLQQGKHFKARGIQDNEVPGEFHVKGNSWVSSTAVKIPKGYSVPIPEQGIRLEWTGHEIMVGQGSRNPAIYVYSLRPAAGLEEVAWVLKALQTQEPQQHQWAASEMQRLLVDPFVEFNRFHLDASAHEDRFGTFWLMRQYLDEQLEVQPKIWEGLLWLEELFRRAGEERLDLFKHSASGPVLWRWTDAFNKYLEHSNELLKKVHGQVSVSASLQESSVGVGPSAEEELRAAEERFRKDLIRTSTEVARIVSKQREIVWLIWPPYDEGRTKTRMAPKDFLDRYHGQLTLDQQAQVKGFERDGVVEVTVFVAAMPFHLYVDSSLADVAQEMINKHPVEGVAFDVVHEIRTRPKTFDGFPSPGLIIPDKSLPEPFEWTGIHIRVESMYRVEFEKILPIAWVAMYWNSYLTLQQVLNLRVLTFQDEEGRTIHAVFA